MTGIDLTSQREASPPREPLPASMLTDRDALIALGDRIAHRTWADGLPSFFWGEGVCLLGAAQFAAAAGRPFPAEVSGWLDEHAVDAVPEHVNNVAPGSAAVLDGRTEHRELATRLVRWLLTDPAVTRAANGAIEHWPDGVWADTVFMAGVLLGRLGEATGDEVLVAEFGRQVVAHAQLLQDETSGLICHGAYLGRTIRCFWGRANAWWALAAVEFLELAPNAPLATEIRQRLVTALTALARHQPEHGVWSVLVDDQPENAGILETSAAAGLGAAMLRASAVLPALDPAVAAAGRRAVLGALAYVDDAGHLTRVSAGTVLQLVPFGYSVIRDDRPQLWGQGLALHAIAAALGTAR